MADAKKVSFGFQKLSKKGKVLSNVVKRESNVHYIDCVEEKAIKVKGAVDEGAEKLLVIPLFKQPNLKSTVKCDAKDCSKLVKNDVSETINEPESLDAIATREILEDVQKAKKEAEETRVFRVPLTTNPPAGEKESSLDDYESVPIVDFGLAMLRGMGWKEGKGIGKNEKLVTTSLPSLRPKGMGLGADMVVKSVESGVNLSKDEVILKTGSCVRIIAGHHKDSYGKVEGFDEISSRVIIKLTLTNAIVSFNEFMVQIVSTDDFNKNSKVINVAKFEEYKEKERNSVFDQAVGTEQRNGPNHSKKQFYHKKSKKYRSSDESSSSSQENDSNESHSKRKNGDSSSDTSSSHSHSPGTSAVPSMHKYKGESVSYRRHKISKHRRTRSGSISPERTRRHFRKSKRKR